MGFGTGGGHTKFCGCEGAQSCPWVSFVKLPRPEIEPVNSGSRFSVTPQSMNGGMVIVPESGPPVDTVYPSGGIVLTPRPTTVRVTGDRVRQPGPTSSGA